MPSVATLAVSVTARTSKFNRKMKQAGKNVREFGRKVADVGKRLVRFGALAGGAAVAGLIVATRQSFKLIDATSKLASTFGIATDQLIGLQHGAVIMGSSLEGMNKGLKEFVRRLGEASSRSGEMRDAIAMLGLDAQTLVAMGTAGALKAVADRIAALPNEFEQAEAAYRVFGRRGTELVKLFRTGGKGIDDFVRRVRLMGLTFTELESAGIQNANDALFELSQTMRGTANQIAVRLQPYVGSLATALTDMAIAGDGVRSRVATAFATVETAIVRVLNESARLAAVWHAFRGVIIGTAALAVRAIGIVSQTISDSAKRWALLFDWITDRIPAQFVGPLFPLIEGLKGVSEAFDTIKLSMDEASLGFAEGMDDAMAKMQAALDSWRTGSAGRKLTDWLDNLIDKWNEFAKKTLEQPKMPTRPLLSLESLRGAAAARARHTEFQQISLSRVAVGGIHTPSRPQIVSDPQLALTNRELQAIRRAMRLLVTGVGVVQ